MPGRGSVRSNRAVNETKWSINISVLLKPIELIAYGVCCRCSANRGTLSAGAYDNPVPSWANVRKVQRPSKGLYYILYKVGTE